MNQKQLSEIREELSHHNWEYLNNKTTVEAFDEFHNNISAVINQKAPLKKTSAKSTQQKQKPWMTKGLLKSAKTQNVLYKKQLHVSKENPKHIHYIKYRNSYNKLKRNAKQTYYNEQLNTYKTDIKKHGKY